MSLYYRPTSHTTSRLVGDEVVIVKLPACEMTVLNASGSLVWLALDGSRDESDLAALLQKQFSLTPPPELADFLTTLEELELISATDTASANSKPLPDLPETNSPYTQPAIKTSEPIETLAGLCDSSWGGFAGCQSFGICLDPFE